MNNFSNRYIILPDLSYLAQKNLKYLDALTYITIRSYDSTEKGYAYPTLEQIAKTAGLGRTFVANSIKRLEKAGLFTIIHSRRKGSANRYYSSDKVNHYERVPYEILNASDLTKYEKALLICLRPFFNSGFLSTSMDLNDFSKYLELSYNQIYGRFNGLVDKGYIVKKLSRIKVKGKAVITLSLSDKINWKFEYFGNSYKLVQEPVSIIIS